MTVTGQENTDFVVNQLAPALRENLVPFPPVKPIQEHAIAVETAEHLCGLSLKHAIRRFAPQVNFDSARGGFVIALDRLDARKIGNSIDKCDSRRKVPRRFARVAKSGRKLEARRLCSSFCHGRVPM